MVFSEYGRQPSPVQARYKTRTRDFAWKARRRSGVRNFEQRAETGWTEEMKRYLIVIEQTETGYSAYSPDLEGCVATGKTHYEVERQMQEAIEFHLDGLARNGHTIPEPHSYSRYVEISAG